MTRRLTRADVKVWRQVARTVKPMADKELPKPPADEDMTSLMAKQSHMDAPELREQSTRGVQPHKPAAPRPSQSQLADRAQLADRGRERKVRRGQMDITATLDLHGHTQDAARSSLAAFLMYHRSMNARCVLVITGKGHMGEGVIRRRFLDWLNASDLKAHVSSWAQSHQKHGGAGAFYVFLKRPDKRH